MNSALKYSWINSGPRRRLRFLGQCEPCTGDFTAERHKWIEDTPDIKTIVKRIQENRERKQATPKNEPPKNIDDMSDIEVYELGLKAISRKLSGPLESSGLSICLIQTKTLTPQINTNGLMPMNEI